MDTLALAWLRLGVGVSCGGGQRLRNAPLVCPSEVHGDSLHWARMQWLIGFSDILDFGPEGTWPHTARHAWL